MKVFNRNLDISLINGCGIFLEIADSRCVWVYNSDSEETTAMPFEGVLLYLPFIVISWGNAYEAVEL